MRLRTYILTRLLLTIPMILILVTVVFIIMRVMPGDPVTALLGGKGGSAEQIALLRHQLGLDQPVYIQYLEYMANLMRGDLGYSLVRQDSVVTELATYLPATLELTFCSALLAILLGVYCGVFAARHAGGKLDASIRIGALVRWCIPVFWFGLALQILVVQTGVALPISGQTSQMEGVARVTGMYVIDAILAGDPSALADALLHLVLPVVTLGTTMAASLTKISRTNVVDVLGEEYIKVASLKGCSEDQVFQKHALPNALIPILTYTGLQVAVLLQGAVLTESVFSWPGVGRLLLFGVGYRDFNLIQGCVVLFALLVSAANLIVDICYAIVDPRVRF
ncbi:MAG: ABC transporter permease [Candidatus Bathyarchaeia archaeon]